MQRISGKKLIEIDAAGLVALVGECKKIWIDLGTGDGKYLYRQARQYPEIFFIGIEPAWENLGDVSNKAQRKAAKGGIPNLLFLCASLEQIPKELHGLADTLSIHYPWGSLLRETAQPSDLTLATLGALAKAAAKLIISLNLQVFEDPTQRVSLALPELSDAHIQQRIIGSFLKIGFKLNCMERSDGPSDVHSSWGQRLSRGSGRSTLHLEFARN